MSSLLEHVSAERSLDAVPIERVWRVSIEQYHAMFDAGILTEDDPVELIDGILVHKMPKNPPHVFALDALRDLLLGCPLQSWIVRVQDPILLDDSEPEPDLVIARGKRRDYVDRHPGPDDIGLVIEVADATLAGDRGFKKRLYAANRIVEYWIVNLVAHEVEVYNEPVGRGLRADYRVMRKYVVGESVPLLLDGGHVCLVPLSELFTA